MGIKKTSLKEAVEQRDLEHDPYRDDKETVVVSVRIHKKRMEALNEYCRRKGLSVNGLIRSVLYDWIETEGLKPSG